MFVVNQNYELVPGAIMTPDCFVPTIIIAKIMCLLNMQ